uniref:Uncharacterized protein n=1 Tax=Octopus bimaculoides TaxID=37653 RepID=A0A0L8HC17_OCTBM
MPSPHSTVQQIWILLSPPPSTLIYSDTLQIPVPSPSTLIYEFTHQNLYFFSHAPPSSYPLQTSIALPFIVIHPLQTCIAPLPHHHQQPFINLHYSTLSKPVLLHTSSQSTLISSHPLQSCIVPPPYHGTPHKPTFFFSPILFFLFQ